MMKRPMLYRIAQIISVLPILVWPVVVHISYILMFDGKMATIVIDVLKFLGINAYPVYIIASLYMSDKLYDSRKILSIALLGWPIIFLMLIVYINL